MPPNELKTIQLPYRPLSAVVTAAVSDLAAGTKTWATFKSTYHPKPPTYGIAVEIPPTWNKLILCFDFENVDADTAVATIYLYTEDGPAEFVCQTGTITAGAQESDFTSTTRYFGDTIATITQRFVGGSAAVEVIDGSGNNGVAKLKFDAVGYKYILCLFISLSTNDEVRAWFRGY